MAPGELIPQPHGGALRRGNPGGKRVKDKIRQQMQEALQHHPDDPKLPGVLSAIIDSALEGNPVAQKMVLEYGIGKPDQTVEVTGQGGGPVLLAPVLATLSDDELDAAAARVIDLAGVDPVRDGAEGGSEGLAEDGEAGADPS